MGGYGTMGREYSVRTKMILFREEIGILDDGTMVRSRAPDTLPLLTLRTTLHAILKIQFLYFIASLLLGTFRRRLRVERCGTMSDAARPGSTGLAARGTERFVV